MTDEPTRETSTPVAPPTRPDAMPVRETRSTWPTVLGVLAIILGGLGILSCAWLMVPTAPGIESDPQPSGGVLEAYQAASDPVWLGISAVQLVGGIGLIRRRRWSRTVLQVWAVLTLVVAIVHAVLVPDMLAETMAQQQSGSSGGPGAAPGAFEIVFYVFVLAGMLFSAAPPVFVLIWFGRQKIRDEVAAWR